MVQGESDAVLDDAVGHYPTSVWPGEFGTSILLAHDVSYFSNLGAVTVGEDVSWIDDCRILTFQVYKTEVTQPGDALPPPPGGKGIALVTCSPTDALFWTPDRLVVLASLVSERSIGQRALPATMPLGFKLSVPAAVASQGLTLEDSGLFVGHLKVIGSPNRAWAESADVLNVARFGYETLAAMKLIVLAGNEQWWQAIALPKLAMPYSLDTEGDFDTTITVQGTHVSTIVLSSPGVTTVTLKVQRGELYVANIASQVEAG